MSLWDRIRGVNSHTELLEAHVRLHGGYAFGSPLYRNEAPSIWGMSVEWIHYQQSELSRELLGSHYGEEYGRALDRWYLAVLTWCRLYGVTAARDTHHMSHVLARSLGWANEVTKRFDSGDITGTDQIPDFPMTKFKYIEPSADDVLREYNTKLSANSHQSLFDVPKNPIYLKSDSYPFLLFVAMMESNRRAYPVEFTILGARWIQETYSFLQPNPQLISKPGSHLYATGYAIHLLLD